MSRKSKKKEESKRRLKNMKEIKNNNNNDNSMNLDDISFVEINPENNEDNKNDKTDKIKLNNENGATKSKIRLVKVTIYWTPNMKKAGLEEDMHVVGYTQADEEINLYTLGEALMNRDMFVITLANDKGEIGTTIAFIRPRNVLYLLLNEVE